MSTKATTTVLAIVLVISMTFAATAYTTGSVTRSANVNVVNDDTGLIALEDGTSGDLVYQNASGALEIDFTKGGAGGVNTAAHFELGDPSSANTSYAFNISNMDVESHDISLDYSGSDGQDADNNIEFQVYDASGTLQTTASEETGAVNVAGVSSGQTLYVVVVVDTHGLDSTADLSGTLKVSA